VSGPAVHVTSIRGGATPEETVAITAAVTALVEQQLASASAAVQPYDGGQLSVWLEASRRAAQRGTLQRGPWRISGRISRRSRI
jgi:hypothetical protein